MTIETRNWTIAAAAMVRPAPTNSNVYDDARISDCLWKGTADPRPTVAGRFWSIVIVETPAVTGVAVFMVK